VFSLTEWSWPAPASWTAAAASNLAAAWPWPLLVPARSTATCPWPVPVGWLLAASVRSAAGLWVGVCLVPVVCPPAGTSRSAGARPSEVRLGCAVWAPAPLSATAWLWAAVRPVPAVWAAADGRLSAARVGAAPVAGGPGRSAAGPLSDSCSTAGRAATTGSGSVMSVGATTAARCSPVARGWGGTHPWSQPPFAAAAPASWWRHQPRGACAG
jgi:hypothetical protein